MTEENNRIPFSKKGQREISPFMGQGLLYDYLNGDLDKERHSAVAAFLETSREAQVEVQKIQAGQQYADQLGQVVISEALKKRLGTPSSYLSLLFKKSRFEQWPVGLKWGLEAVVVVFVIVTFLTVAPWEKVMKLKLAPSSNSNEVVLSEVHKTSPLKETPTSVAAGQGPQDTPQFVDEGIKKEPPPAPAPAAATTVAAATNPPPKASPPARPSMAKKAPEKTAVAVAAHKDEEEAEDSTEGSKSIAGYLYRGQIKVTNVSAVGPKIAEKIAELGGRKAGSVSLGWQKTPDSAYFHFTIPEAKYEELQAFLSGYGTVKISKEKHPRVMPDGIIRLIITVDEATK